MNQKNETLFFYQSVEELFSKDMPLMDLISKAHQVHAHNHEVGKLERCTLLSVKTGACPEDCAYCAQSSRYKTGVFIHQLLDRKQVLQAAQKALEMPTTYFCLGASGRAVKNDQDFETLLKMVEEITALGLKVCCTLGMLDKEQAVKLKQAGCYGYNHNLDTGPKYYQKIVTTRSYADRLKTLEIVQEAGLKVCTGVILGMGETITDRIEWVKTLQALKQPPDFIPINVLIPIKGTPLEKRKTLPIGELLRMIAVLRVVFPKVKLRFAAGRGYYSHAEQALTFFAGINSIHSGEKLLTVKDCSLKEDEELFRWLELTV